MPGKDRGGTLLRFVNNHRPTIVPSIWGEDGRAGEGVSNRRTVNCWTGLDFGHVGITIFRNVTNYIPVHKA